MACFQNSVCCHRNRQLGISLLFVFVSSLVQVSFMAEGRAIPKETETSPLQKRMEEDKLLITRSMIGSSPPKCERRCSSCKHCEAIQVPVTTQLQAHGGHFSAVSYYSGRDISNYKPMSWKCKCGNLIFNP
ncbi:EPIDERMAL PATTERNING FACTOR-like protein 2 [Mangifera indica]|uniref:EPIDERMAL PATTERNING FACTOR-like protein 2 n=1 Tax=Mangifera indica TaxID=29780 RepID=UPI001CFA6F1F|nr:EPIDERMAL PATTERNING FACTOR-like protein 2 [Mangifera indica]